MKRLILGLLLAVIAWPALAQNLQCPTRPVGDSTNACASTAFVQNQGFIHGGGTTVVGRIAIWNDTTGTSLTESALSAISGVISGFSGTGINNANWIGGGGPGSGINFNTVTGGGFSWSLGGAGVWAIGSVSGGFYSLQPGSGNVCSDQGAGTICAGGTGAVPLTLLKGTTGNSPFIALTNPSVRTWNISYVSNTFNNTVAQDALKFCSDLPCQVPFFIKAYGAIQAGDLSGRPNLVIPGPPTGPFVFGGDLAAGDYIYFGPTPYVVITGVVNDGTGKIRINISSDPSGTLANGRVIQIAGIIGTGGLTANANGFWTIQNYVAGTSFVLTGSTFTGAYTSGGEFITGGDLVQIGRRLQNSGPSSTVITAGYNLTDYTSGAGATQDGSAQIYVLPNSTLSTITGLDGQPCPGCLLFNTYGNDNLVTYALFAGRASAGTWGEWLRIWQGALDIRTGAAAIPTNGVYTPVGQTNQIAISTNGVRALLFDASQNVTFTVPIPIGSGGTNRSTLTANAFLTGNGTSSINMVAITGLVLGNGASAPTAYTGTSCAANTFITSLSALGVSTCAGVSPGAIALTNTHILVGNVSNVAVDIAMSGDATIANTGILTLASTIAAGGPTGSATVSPIITYDIKGRLTAVSSATITPAISNITGLGTGVATALAVNIGTAGSFITNGGVLGTPSSGTLTNVTGLPLSGLSTQATNTIVGNATSGSASPTALSIGSCSTASSALIWTTNTGFGCNTSITASVATNVTATATSTNAVYYPTFVASSSTGSQGLGMDADFNYNPSTNLLTLGTTSAANLAIGGAAQSSPGNFNVSLYAGSSTGQAGYITIAQDGSHGFGLSYNANTTVGNGGAQILTLGYNNPMTFDASAVSIQTLSTSANNTVSIGTVAQNTVTTINNTVDATTISTGSLINKGGFATNKRVFMNGLTTSAGLQTAVLCQSSAGEVIADSVACLASAARFKEGFTSIPIEEIRRVTDKLLVKSWHYIREPDSVFPDRYYRERVSLIADDVAEIDPRLVEYDKDGKVRTIDYNGIVSMLSARVQDLDHIHNARISVLEAANDNLKREVRSLKRRMAR